MGVRITQNLFAPRPRPTRPRISKSQITMEKYAKDGQEKLSSATTVFFWENPKLSELLWTKLKPRCSVRSSISTATKQKCSFAVFCGLVSELANVWDGQVELAGSVVGGGSEVDEVLESPSHSLC